MGRKKACYILDVYDDECAMTGFLITKWEAIQLFIGFLRNPQYRQITFTKVKENKDDKAIEE